jgi:hypothetical protein
MGRIFSIFYDAEAEGSIGQRHLICLPMCAPVHDQIRWQIRWNDFFGDDDFRPSGAE